MKSREESGFFKSRLVSQFFGLKPGGVHDKIIM
jgi:hypothetical protein